MVALLLSATAAYGAQNWDGKRLYFGDMHWHTCLAGHATATLEGQYESMFNDYGLDFSMESEHAEGAEQGVNGCGTYLPDLPPGFKYTGESIANPCRWQTEIRGLSRL
jgi:hypothetical protein